MRRIGRGVLLAFAVFSSSQLAASTLTWTGAEGGNWSAPGNWSLNRVPTAADTLVFPADAANHSMTNDLPPGSVFGPVNVTGNSYTLSGNALSLQGDWDLGSATGFVCNATLKLLATVTISHGSKPLFNGAVDINGQSLYIFSDDPTVSGPLTGSTGFARVDGFVSGGGPYSGTLTGDVIFSGSMPNVTFGNAPFADFYGSGTVGDAVVQRMDPGARTGVNGPTHDIGVVHAKNFTVSNYLAVDFNATGGSDQVQATGSVTVAGAQFLPSLVGGATASAPSYTIIDNEGSAPINGTLNGLPEGATITLGITVYAISYKGGDGNDLVLTRTATLKTWTGASGGSWSSASNWNPQTAPVAGETLVFPAQASNFTMTNDLPAGSVFGSMTFNSSSYTLSGNAMSLQGDWNLNASSTPGFTCDAPWKLLTPVTIRGGLHAQFGGAIDVNGQSLSIFADDPTVTGPLSGTGFVRIDGFVSGGGSYSGTLAGDVIFSGSMPNVTFGNAPFADLYGSGTVGDAIVQRMDPGARAGVNLPTHDIGVFHTKIFSVSSFYAVDLDSSGACDQVQATGAVTVSGANLLTSITGGAPAFGQSFTIIDNKSSAPVSGTFSFLPEGAKVVSGGVALRTSYVGGDGNDVTLTVADDTSTSIAQSSATTLAGESTTFTATVASKSGVPDGAVTFTDGVQTLGSVPLVNGVAQLTTSNLPVGAHSVVAAYAGASKFFGSTSAPMTHAVHGQTRTTLTGGNLATFGQPLSLFVAVNPLAPATGIVTGTVSLLADGTSIASGTLANGAVALGSASLSAGQHAFTASYAGNADFLASSSDPITIVIAKAATTTVAQSNLNPAPAGASVVLTVSIAAQTSAMPAGTITVSDGGTVVAQEPLTSRPALTLTNLAVGDHDLSVTYSGDGNFAGSTFHLHQVVRLPVVTANDLIVSEGDSGSAVAPLTLHLELPATQTVRVNWKTVDGSATAGEDYQASSGTVEFAPGESSHDIPLSIYGDTKPERDETFTVQLADATNASLARSSISVVIQNDDATFSRRSLAYAARASGPLTLDLYTPLVGAPPYPVVVWVPGFTTYDADTTFVPALHEILRGYAVAVVRYRTPDVAHFPAQSDDLRSAIRYLRANATQYGLDAQHIAVWGNGAGAHLAALAGLAGDLTPPIENAAIPAGVQAVVDWNGPSQLLALNADASSCLAIDHDLPSSPESLLLGCALQTCPAAAAIASPVTYVHSGAAPFLIMQAGADCYVGPGQSRTLYDLLSHAGVDATLHVYEGVAHVDPFWNSDAALAVVDAFLDGKLRPRPSRSRGTRH